MRFKISESISVFKHNGVKINSYIRENLSESDEFNNKNNDFFVIVKNLEGSFLNFVRIQKIFSKSYVDIKLCVISFSR